MRAKLVGACLKLLVAMVMQGVESARELQSVFNFGYKPLSVFVNRNNTIEVCHFKFNFVMNMIFANLFMPQGETESIRELLMKFALSFLQLGDPLIVTALLEFKGEIRVHPGWRKIDSYSVTSPRIFVIIF